MNMKLLICALLLALPTFAGNACDLFVGEVNSIKPEDSGIFSNGKINYSRAYTEVPFLERMQPGIYISLGGHVAVIVTASPGFIDEAVVVAALVMMREGSDHAVRRHIL